MNVFCLLPLQLLQFGLLRLSKLFMLHNTNTIQILSNAYKYAVIVFYKITIWRIFFFPNPYDFERRPSNIVVRSCPLPLKCQYSLSYPSNDTAATIILITLSEFWQYDSSISITGHLPRWSRQERISCQSCIDLTLFSFLQRENWSEHWPERSSSS